MSMPTADSVKDAGQKGHVQKFQELLRELFQFDCADLDFGIYRIMNHKRDVVERFIAEKLPKTIDEELNTGLLARQALAKAKLEEAREKVLEVLGRDAIAPNGEIGNSALAGTPVAQEYLDAKARAGASRSRAAVEADVYNHLTAFFRRYYEDGDFVSKRRYSRKHRYAIPYNGEEVYLHWANADQYYVKTAEHFHSYGWKAPNGVSVRFLVKEANVEQDNVKGERRFFLPNLTDGEWDESTRTVTLPFAYRPLNGQEKRRYSGNKQQEKIIAATVEALTQRPGERLGADALAALGRERRRNAKDEPVSHLEHHLRRYTRRNDSDFFIHKDLRGFLTRELDFYLKNEVLNLDDLAAAGEFVGEGWFQLMELMRSVGGQIIDFLAQIEGFQKMLWEKRKFVTETNYCVAMRCVPPELHAEVAGNETQWAEWRDLAVVGDEQATLFDSCQTPEQRLAFLHGKPTLMLDTVHFDADWTDRLLGGFDDLDGMTDGVLLHSENWQALRLMRHKYSKQVACVHIDPPYNTQTSGFLYKNGYQHSSWLAMMQSHLGEAFALLGRDGHLLCHIDENENERLHLLFDQISSWDLGTVVWDKKNPMMGGRGIATQHEYIVCLSRSGDPLYVRDENAKSMLKQARELVRLHGAGADRASKEFSAWVSKNRQLTGGERAYRYLDDSGRVYRGVSLSAPERRTASKFFVPLIHPLTGKPCPVPPNGHSRTPETLRTLADRGEILFGRDDTTQPQRKLFLDERSGRQFSSVLHDAKRGKADLDALGVDNFPYCHAVSLYEALLGATARERDGVVVDYFAGSGTSGHAVINLNREDDGRRKFVLVEVGGHFATVLLPRLKKVAFSPRWKDGRPDGSATAEEAERSPRLIKYMRLESYEDALDSIRFEEDEEQLRLAEELDGYLLNYMLEWETKDSETLLNPAELVSPFNYLLRVHENGDVRERGADVAETFNYLLGLDVRTRRVYQDGGHRYLVFRGETLETPGRTTVVIWRDTEGWSEDELAADRDFVAAEGMAEGADVVYVNGMSSIPAARPVEPLFKARMFAGVSGA